MAQRIAVLYGGTSGEREVSLVSGSIVADTLAAEGLEVERIDTGKPDFFERLVTFQPDIAFIALHGKGGEDGSIQGLLELLDIPYTGSGVLASALAMDKARSKVFYLAEGLNVPPSNNVDRDAPYSISALCEQIGLPCVVKPVREGSSLGVYIVHTADELEPAIEAAFKCSENLLVERFVAGMEVTVAVLGNNDASALPLIEIIPHAAFYDYEAKYADGGSEHVCPARLSAELTALCQEHAVLAHKALGCRGVSRTDFIIDVDDVPWVIETNTIPGMTGTSLLPHAAEETGMSLGELYRKLIEYGLE